MAFPGLSLKIRQFADDRQGNFALLFALTASVLAFAGGMAVDLAQAYGEKSHVSAALDAAVLATTTAISTGEITPTQAEAYLDRVFAANTGRSVANPGRYTLGDVTVDTDTKTVSASASFLHETAFGILGNAGTFTVGARSGASYGGSQEKVEVAMVFDLTGSMDEATKTNGKWVKKIDSLKVAASDGVDQLLGLNAGGKEVVRIAEVPYAAGVNVGSTFAPYVYPDNGKPDTVAPDYDPNAAVKVSAKTDTCATERKKDVGDWTDAGPEDGMINRDGRLAGCPSAKIIPLTANGTVLKDAISRFQASGTTAGQIGIQWAWYMLSPNWAGVMPSGAEPAKAGEKVKKYAIFMTDGEFNTAYAGVKPGANVTNQPNKSSSYAVDICAAMKAQGIEIFTIGFALDTKAARDTLKACASPDKPGMVYYHEASNGSELSAIYSGISTMIRKLRLIY